MGRLMHSLKIVSRLLSAVKRETSRSSGRERRPLIYEQDQSFIYLCAYCVYWESYRTKGREREGEKSASDGWAGGGNGGIPKSGAKLSGNV